MATGVGGHCQHARIEAIGNPAETVAEGRPVRAVPSRDVGGKDVAGFEEDASDIEIVACWQNAINDAVEPTSDLGPRAAIPAGEVRRRHAGDIGEVAADVDIGTLRCDSEDDGD